MSQQTEEICFKTKVEDIIIKDEPLEIPAAVSAGVNDEGMERLQEVHSVFMKEEMEEASRAQLIKTEEICCKTEVEDVIIKDEALEIPATVSAGVKDEGMEHLQEVHSVFMEEEMDETSRAQDSSVSGSSGIAKEEVAAIGVREQRRANKIFQRGKIVGMKKAGKSPKEISDILGVSLSTVYKWTKRYDNYETMEDKPRSGQPKKTTVQEDQAIIAAAEADPFPNAVSITKELNVNASVHTVRRRLHASGGHRRTPCVQEKLTEDHRRRRFEFARQFANEGSDFWGKVVFTDEKTLCSSDYGQLHCWRSHDVANIHEEMRRGHVTVNIWGWINLHYHGDLSPIYGKFNTDQYLEILEEVMLPSVRSVFPHSERILYVQGNSPTHRSRRVWQWFENQRDIELLEWPNLGYDMNPMENVWTSMVSAWDPVDERTSAELFAHATRVYRSVRRRPQFISGLIQSVPERLQAVINANGGWTKF